MLFLLNNDGVLSVLFFFSSRRRHTSLQGDWSSDVCSSDLAGRVPSSADTGNLRGDLMTVMRAMRGHLTDEFLAMMSGLTHAMRTDPELAGVLRSHLANDYSAALPIIRRAAERGEVTAGAQEALASIAHEVIEAQLFRQISSWRKTRTWSEAAARSSNSGGKPSAGPGQPAPCGPSACTRSPARATSATPSAPSWCGSRPDASSRPSSPPSGSVTPTGAGGSRSTHRALTLSLPDLTHAGTCGHRSVTSWERASGSGGDGADLLHQGEDVHAHPALGEQAVLDPPDVDILDLDRGARGRHAHEFALVSAGPTAVADHLVLPRWPRYGTRYRRSPPVTRGKRPALHIAHIAGSRSPPIWGPTRP